MPRVASSKPSHCSFLTRQVLESVRRGEAEEADEDFAPGPEPATTTAGTMAQHEERLAEWLVRSLRMDFEHQTSIIENHKSQGLCQPPWPPMTVANLLSFQPSAPTMDPWPS